VGAHDLIPRKLLLRGGNQRVITLERGWAFGLDDDQFFLYDNLDDSKRVRFQLAGLAANTERTYTLPNADGTLVVGGYSTQVEALTFILNGFGAPLATGVAGDLPVPFAATITEVWAMADTVGSLVVDIWKDVFPTNYPPVVGDSITGGNPVTISTSNASKNTTLVNWTTALAAGTSLRFNVQSCSTITRCTIALIVQRVI